MPSKNTQKLILDAAIELFNRHGTAPVSVNRIVEHCALRRGNLFYHYKKKSEIVGAIYDRVALEMRAAWTCHSDPPGLQDLLDVFDRQIALTWRYRFFYREMPALLVVDEPLRERVSRDRRDRSKVIVEFLALLVGAGVLLGPTDQRALNSLVRASMIVTDNWLNCAFVESAATYPACIREGYQLMLELFRPYLSPRTLCALSATVDCGTTGEHRPLRMDLRAPAARETS